MLWIIVIYLASVVLARMGLKSSIESAKEDGEMDDIQEHLISVAGSIAVLIPAINTIMALITCYGYAVEFLQFIHFRIYYWYLKRKLGKIGAGRQIIKELKQQEDGTSTT